MRSGSDGRPRRSYNGNRPFQPQQQRSQTYDSNGPSVRIRGSAQQLFERYVALAREAAISGDPIAAENLYQHAEHYFRLANASRDSVAQGAPPPPSPADAAPPEPEADGRDDPRPGFGDHRPGFL
jgi:hypothetical protein